MKRVFNKLKRLKTEFQFQHLPTKFPLVSKNENTVYMYHGIDSIGDIRFNSRHTSSSCFEQQLKFFKENCNTISAKDFMNRKFHKTKPNIAITIDDGYYNNLKFGLELIEKYQIPTTIFITGLNNTKEKIIWADFLNLALYKRTSSFHVDGAKFSFDNGAFINQDGIDIYSFIKEVNASYNFKKEIYSELKSQIGNILEENSDYWKLLSDEDIKTLSQSKWITIGSHGYLHNNLGSIPLINAKDEIFKSKQYLENLIQMDIDTLGYPDSSYSRELIEYAFQLGFKYQFATENYLFPEDYQDERIHHRKGIYTCDSCGNQLI